MNKRPSPGALAASMASARRATRSRVIAASTPATADELAAAVARVLGEPTEPVEGGLVAGRPRLAPLASPTAGERRRRRRRC